MRRNEKWEFWGGLILGGVYGVVCLVLIAALMPCAIVNGSAYRVQPCPTRSDTTATADSLRRHIGCFDTTDSTKVRP